VDHYYKAHWGTLLKVISTFVSLLMIGMSVLFFCVVPIEWVKLLMFVFTLLILVPAALFTVRGYTVTENELLIQRLFWETRIPLRGLVSAQVTSDAFRKCIRIFGNGGLFSFSGWFYSKSLGRFRAFATDLNRTVALRFEKRTIVISPSEPEAFVKDINTFACSTNH
jgi:hypothetical protein